MDNPTDGWDQAPFWGPSETPTLRSGRTLPASATPGAPVPASPVPSTGPHRLPEEPPYGRQTVAAQPPPAPPAPLRRRLWPAATISFLSALVGALVVVGVLALTGTFDEEPVTVVAPTIVPPTVVQNPTTEIITGAADGGVAEAVGKKVVPSIVTVQVGSVIDGTFTPEATGSGVLLDREGHLVTNHHVVADADAASVTLHNGLIYEAEIIGTDPVTDLAVLKIDASALAPIDNGHATDLAIGQTAIAIGNPLGQEGGASLTVGVISALDRIVDFGPNEQSLYGMVQTDAPINSGSSGGALVDAEGALIGITSAIGVSQAGAEGIGYAIPVELVERVTAEIIEIGEVHHTFLGILGGDHLVDTPDGALAPGGAVIDSLFGDDSAAAAAGLADGDVIVRVGDDPVTSMQDLVVALRLYRVGDAVEVEVDRAGTSVATNVILIERPDDS